MIRATKVLRAIWGVAALTCASLLAADAGAEPAGSQSWPSHISASYKITFNGFDLGHFNYTSEVGRSGYALSSDAQLSALLGMFQWFGKTRSSGSIAAEDPRPVGYSFEFQSSSKSGAIKMGFTDTRISSLSVVPPGEVQPDVVPVREQHVRDVLDPLSAVMAITRASANPCARKLSIFDGKQRFDLVFSFRRQEKVVEKHATGLPPFAHVCRVRYVPIAGYRPSEQTKQLSEEAGIEVSLRPVPHANLVVPYQVTIPTFAGTASMTLSRVEITTSDKRQIALVQ